MTNLSPQIVLHHSGVCSHLQERSNLPGQTLPDQMCPFQWSFSADMLAVDPGESYKVFVYNIPRPELHHSHYDVSADVIAPGGFLVVVFFFFFSSELFFSFRTCSEL